MKIRRIILGLMILGSTLGLFARPAAAGEPVADCPDHFNLVPTETHEEGPSVDKNLDGWVCDKPLPGVGNVGFFNVIDNKFPIKD